MLNFSRQCSIIYALRYSNQTYCRIHILVCAPRGRNRRDFDRVKSSVKTEIFLSLYSEFLSYRRITSCNVPVVDKPGFTSNIQSVLFTKSVSIFYFKESNCYSGNIALLCILIIIVIAAINHYEYLSLQAPVPRLPGMKLGNIVSSSIFIGKRVIGILKNF